MAAKRPREDDYFICPCCGAKVRTGAKFCRECGASDEFGWDEDGHWWDDELPTGYAEEDDFDYDEFVEREFPGQAKGWSRHRVKKVVFTVVIIVVCVALLIWTMR